jgi:spermidine/putrescine transport system permease protein
MKMPAKLFGVSLILLLMLLFIYLPVAILVLFSFQGGPIPVPPFDGPSLRWYVQILKNDAIVSSTGISIVVGTISSAVATLLATVAAWGLARYRIPGRTAIEILLYMPLAVSYLVIGIGLLVTFTALGVGKSIWAVMVGHVDLNLPLAFAVVYAQFEPEQVRFEHAARDLGASELQVFLKVTVPLLRPAIIAAFLLSFTFSWDEFIVSFLLSGFQPTLPVVIWGMLRSGLDPQINAAGSLVFLLSIAAALVFELTLLRRKKNEPLG